MTKNELNDILISLKDWVVSAENRLNRLELNSLEQAIATNEDSLLVQPAQEPVDVARVQEDGSVEWNPNLPDLPVGTKLYTHHAPAKEWVELSGDEVDELFADMVKILGIN